MAIRTTNGLLESIFVSLLDMNIMTAMKMLHDPACSYSDREKEYLNEFADIPLNEDNESLGSQRA